MTKLYVQRAKRFSKINHTYYFIDAVRRKDYLNICRHFLWLMNRQNNQPTTQKSIVSTITELTKFAGLDSRTLTNALVEMKKYGELERFKGIHNRVGWNPNATNQIRWSNFRSSYSGLPLREYTNDEEICASELEKLAKTNSYSYQSLDDYEHTREMEQEDADMTVALQKISNLESTIESLETTVNEMKHMLSDMVRLLKKHEPEEAEKVERHLTLVKTEVSNLE